MSKEWGPYVSRDVATGFPGKVESLPDLAVVCWVPDQISRTCSALHMKLPVVLIPALPTCLACIKEMVGIARNDENKVKGQVESKKIG